MAEYSAPIKDIRFTLEHIADLGGLARSELYASAEPELVAQVLTEAGKLASETWAPLNQPGDRQGCVLENGVVRSPDGFAEAYRAFTDGGWNGIAADPAYGGMGLPLLVGTATDEMWNAANMGLSLCPLLTKSAVEAIHAHGTNEQKQTYLAKLVGGEWSGTMNLTEPQAGSDVGALRSTAEPAADGSWRIKGQKIFISHGEHELAENIVHLVLARTPDSPEGTRGISLFVVPKYLPDGAGGLGQRNDLRCVALERKLGLHGGPTCVMSYGDGGGAIGWLLGPERQGMRCMFTMMNAARLAVGVQGVAIAERATQRAVAYALERRQGQALGADEPGPSPIVRHADVRRMLMTMKALTEAARAVCYVTAEAIDRARAAGDDEERERAQGRVEVLTPIAKAWSTDVGCEVTSLGVQVHGGMGFIEETGAAQHYRDVRVLPIYEGTNGIQAMDLAMRKLGLAGGEPLDALLDGLDDIGSAIQEADTEFHMATANLVGAQAALRGATDRMRDFLGREPNAAAAAATPYLKMWGLTLGAHLLAKGAMKARELLNAGGAVDAGHLQDRIAVARFFCEQLLPEAPAQLAAIGAGADILYAVPEERLAG